jgi:hypothetical protein
MLRSGWNFLGSGLLYGKHRKTVASLKLLGDAL